MIPKGLHITSNFLSSSLAPIFIEKQEPASMAACPYLIFMELSSAITGVLKAFITWDCNCKIGVFNNIRHTWGKSQFTIPFYLCKQRV